MASAVEAMPSQVRAEKSTLTPPCSVRLPPKPDDASSSELSDLEEDDDIGDVEPDHYYGGGKVPVFKPTMAQFRSFKKFIAKIDKYGMKSGIVKVIPPKEWRDALPPLDEAVKTIKVKNPITQEIAGSQGTYRQVNIEKQRSYNLPQWRQLCEGSDHQPPARRGERRRNQPAVARPGTRPAATTAGAAKKGRGGKSKKQTKSTRVADASHETEAHREDETKPIDPLTPTSAEGQLHGDEKERISSKEPAVKLDVDDDDVGEAETGTPGKGKGRQPKTVSERRKYNRKAAAGHVDEAAFKGFDYRIQNLDEYTPERCEELEKNYWKSITYNSPLYGADMPGSLFDDRTTSWNVAKLENLLDVLGQNVPGVNTAYLYLGMWKSTFAWHLEDVDLYSINYIHFGAPKQWYSISQEDARRFEAAMKSVWPADAKQCSQFLRHKTYLISPTLLQSQYNIRVNRLVHHEGEFVITFPYGYHSGYNLGYNCAESVNFATEAWLEYGRVAKKCNCAEDSVWVDVYDIERKLRGEVSEYEETEDEGDDNEDGSTLTGAADLPTPPASVAGVSSQVSRKRKRDPPNGTTNSKTNVKKIRVRIKAPVMEPCILCPNDIPSEQLLPTDAGKEAHRLCALYTPETFIDGSSGSEKVCNVSNIDKARLNLKCNYCRSKRGACFQCSQPKCVRAYHATCAAAAGVLVDMRDLTVVGEDGKESTDVGIDFRCRFHRPRRPKNLDGDILEESKVIQNFARMLQVGDVIQMQFFRGDIFAGVVVENRVSEEMVLVDILPKGDRVEVEYKWILVHDPAESIHPADQTVKQRAMPSKQNKKPRTNVNLNPPSGSGLPMKNEPFNDPAADQVWAEFKTTAIEQNPDQMPVDTSTPNTVWHYLGQQSTQWRDSYTEDVQYQRPNHASNFKDHVDAINAARAASQPSPSASGKRGSEEPYQYRSRLTGLGKFDKQFEKLQEEGRQRSRSPSVTGAYSTYQPMTGFGQQYHPGQTTGVPYQASPVTGANYYQPSTTQLPPVTSATYFQQSTQPSMSQGSPLSGPPTFYQQTQQVNVQSGMPATGSGCLQQPQGSNAQYGPSVSGLNYLEQPVQGSIQQSLPVTGANYFQQEPQPMIKRPTSAYGSSYFHHSQQRGVQQSSPVLASNYIQQPQHSPTQQQASAPGSNHFQQPQQGNIQQPTFSQPHAPTTNMSRSEGMDIDHPAPQNLAPQPQQPALSTNVQGYYQQAQHPTQQAGATPQQPARNYRHVANMGYSQDTPRHSMEGVSSPQQSRAIKVPMSPHQSLHSARGMITETYLPVGLTSENKQSETQQGQVTIQPVTTQETFTQPVVIEPVATQPVATTPTVSTEPISTQPVATTPTVSTEPISTQPVVTAPTVSTEPASTQPILTQPTPPQPIEQAQGATEQGPTGLAGLTARIEQPVQAVESKQIEEGEKTPKGSKRDFSTFWDDMKAPTPSASSTPEAVRNLFLTEIEQEGSGVGFDPHGGAGNDGAQGEGQN
ncbi:MAG: hypothetical protein M1816_002554 [Peltula sp. TS41687]|nr:MAG: hypothetical protein M1816_002554 [Peltula sp. TS41687]